MGVPPIEEAMINTFCGRRFPSNYRVEVKPDVLGLVVRRGDGSLLAEFEERLPERYVPSSHLGHPSWALRKGWNVCDVIRMLEQDIEAERTVVMDRKAHMRMRAAALNRHRHMALPNAARRAFL